MESSEAKEVEATLAKPNFHQEWISEFYTGRNPVFYDIAFDYIVRHLNAAPHASILDAGCGNGVHAVQLAKHGFRVTAVDFSKSALAMAEATIQEKGFRHQVTLQQENLTALSFADNTFDFVLCWGVLMHIPNVDEAIAELSRVLKPMGKLVLSEGNMRSLDAVALRTIKRFWGNKSTKITKVPAGIEYRVVREAGNFFTRIANIPWFIQAFRQQGLGVDQHIGSQLTESFTRIPSVFLKTLIQIINEIWLKYIKVKFFASGQLLIFRKCES